MQDAFQDVFEKKNYRKQCILLSLHIMLITIVCLLCCIV